MVGPEALAKLLLDDLSNIIGTSILVRLPPVLCYALELSGRKKHLLMVATIYFQHVCIRIQSFITSLIVASRGDKIGLMAIETREEPP